MSGSLRDLSKAIVTALSGAVVSGDGEFPQALSDNIRAYIDKRDKRDQGDAQRLHEELLTAYKKYVLVADSEQERLFLLLVRELLSCLTPYEVGVQFWIDQFIFPGIDSAGRLRVVVEQARIFLMEVMVYDVNDNSPDLAHYEALSQYCADALVRIYLGVKQISNGTEISPAATDDNAERQILCMQNAELELRRFGSRRPKAFFNVLDRYLVLTEYRVAILTLLCSYMQAQPPHLFETHTCSLVGHLYDCLLHDRSAIAVNLACTIFVMLLSHICSILGPTLPKVFAVYARLIYWDILYKKQISESGREDVEFTADDRGGVPNHVASDRVNSSGTVYGGYYYYDDSEGQELGLEAAKPKSEEDSTSWRVLYGDLHDPVGASPDSTTVNYSRLFTFIYGMYPIHFLTFLTSPRRYFRLRGADLSQYLDFEIDDIALRSQDMSQRHLLHPNFFRYTFETEATDKQRWDLAGSAEDIAAFCITLDTKNLEMPEMQEPAVIFRGFHDQLESSLVEQQPPYLSLDESANVGRKTGSLFEDEHVHEDTLSLNNTANEELNGAATFLFALDDRIGIKDKEAGIPFDIGGESSKANPVDSANAVPDTNFEEQPLKGIFSPPSRAHTASISSISASVENPSTPIAANGNIKRPMLDIETILDDHKDINSRVLSRRGSFESGAIVSPTYKRAHDSISESFASLSSPISRTNSNVVKEAVFEVDSGSVNAVKSPPARIFSQSPAVHGSPAAARQYQRSPMTFMQLSHTDTASSSDIKRSQELLPVILPLSYLQRQLLVLRNELNFERYLKQLRLRNLQRLKEQHSSLQRDEANRQGLILSNRILQAKVLRLQNESKKQHASLTKIASDRAKYSNQLLQKNRDLKAERDRWKSEEESIRGALDASRREVHALKQAFLDKEAEIERLGRRLKDVTLTANEVDSLRSRYSVLQSRVLEMYAKGERGSDPLTDANTDLQARVAQLELRVKTAEMESKATKMEASLRIEELLEEIVDLRNRKLGVL